MDTEDPVLLISAFLRNSKFTNAKKDKLRLFSAENVITYLQLYMPLRLLGFRNSVGFEIKLSFTWVS